MEVNKVRILSFLSDGSTNAGILKEEAVYAGNILHGGAMTQFASVKNLNKSDAVGILKVINEVLLGLESSDTLNDEEKLNNFYAKLVNSNFDGGSVMNGSISGVQTRMKERQNGLMCTHCTAHRLKLIVRDSIKFDNYLDRVDEIISNIFKFYYYQPLLTI